MEFRRVLFRSQTVPVAVAVVGAETIAAQGIQTTGDIQKLVPGVILNGAGSMSNSTYTIRGQGKAVTGPGLQSVITYFNEVPLPSIGSRSEDHTSALQSLMRISYAVFCLQKKKQNENIAKQN